LEAWKVWLSLHDFIEGEGEKEKVNGLKTTKKQWTDDEGLLPSQTLVTSPKVADVSTTPPREWIVVAIREHVSLSLWFEPVFSNPSVSQMDEILQTFVFPDSRAQFIDTLRKIRDDLGEDAEKFLSSHQAEFWSYKFLNSGALASTVSMSVKQGKQKE
jgi:hypothetical protein